MLCATLLHGAPLRGQLQSFVFFLVAGCHTQRTTYDGPHVLGARGTLHGNLHGAHPRYFFGLI